MVSVDVTAHIFCENVWEKHSVLKLLSVIYCLTLWKIMFGRLALEIMIFLIVIL